MSRPKSEQTLMMEREKAIRKQRRDLKKAEREKRQAWRAARKRYHELAINADLKPKGLPEGSVPELIRYKATLLCSVCHETRRGDSPDKSADYICEECLHKGGDELDKHTIKNLRPGGGVKTRRTPQSVSSSLQKNLFGGDKL